MFDYEEIFHPFSIPDEYEDDYFANIYPDSNYFNKFDFKLAKSCHYYNENKFNNGYTRNTNSKMKITKPFSMCHIYIRSVAKNMDSFVHYMGNLSHL